MAKFVLKDAVVTVNSVILSTRVKSVTLNVPVDVQEAFAMGDTAKAKFPGLIDWSVDLEFYQDFAAANVDATLWPLVGADPWPFAVRPTSAAISATNPSYNGNVILTSYQPIGGEAGSIAMAPVKLDGAGTLARAVA